MASEGHVECPQEKWDTTCMHALICAGNPRVHRIIGGQSMSGPSVGQVAPGPIRAGPAQRSPQLYFPAMAVGSDACWGYSPNTRNVNFPLLVVLKI